MKVKVKEAFGVNAQITLCSNEDCVTSSVQIGTSEILFTKLNKGQKYSIDIGYANSIIQMSSFFECPHMDIEFSMIPETEVREMMKHSHCTH